MDEKELLKKVRDGDTAAFNQLITLYQPKIFQHCLGIVKDKTSAEDLSQEAFLRAFSKLKTFHEESSFYTWVFRIAHNLSLNYLKKTKKIKTEEFRDELMHAPRTENRSPEIEAAIIVAIGKLDEKHRVVFEMYELEKKPQKEIAALLNIPLGTVRSRLHYARKKMRALLEMR